MLPVEMHEDTVRLLRMTQALEAANICPRGNRTQEDWLSQVLTVLLAEHDIVQGQTKEISELQEQLRELEADNTALRALLEQRGKREKTSDGF